MNISFKNLEFLVENEKVILKRFGKFENISNYGFSEVHISGEDKIGSNGVKMINSSEGTNQKYVSHTITDNSLCIVQKTDKTMVSTYFISYNDTCAVSVYSEVENISQKTIVLEEVSSFVLGGLSTGGVDDFENMYITKFYQSHHSECQPRRHCFTQFGFHSDNEQSRNYKKISFANVGTWSTKESLPQAIIENSTLNEFLMFQIESADSWYYEISDRNHDIYLYLGGANSTYGSWSKELTPGDKYTTKAVALVVGDSLNGVISDMTRYRRHISGLSPVDYSLPSIYNSYMHLAWDNPTEEETLKVAPVVAKTGAEYYVIDCGWHNEEPGDIIYPYVGQWKESKTRFPKGVRYITDYIRSLGMKAGLWIEPEIVGNKCAEMIEYYGDDCFLKRNGKKIQTHSRYFLDYRHPKVISYMTETIRRMVQDYGADYIKFDCNQDCGVGNDTYSTSLGEGLEESTKAFFDWISSVKAMFPDVIFEGCASGGMRMDYKALSYFSLISTSDQTRYLKYPYIAGNVLSAVVPEQAAVWSYPIGFCTVEDVTKNMITMNMINSFLGRMHLASHLEYLNDEQLSYITDGICVYNSIKEFKRKAVPYLPLGFTQFGNEIVSAGLEADNKVYLAVWNLFDTPEVSIPVRKNISDAKIIYPFSTDSTVDFFGNTLNVHFDSPQSAVFIEYSYVK